MRLRTILSSLAMIAPFILPIVALLYVSEIRIVGANDTNIPLNVGADHDGDAHRRQRRYADDGFLSISVGSEDKFTDAPSGAHTFGAIRIINTHKSDAIIIRGVETFNSVKEEIPQVRGTNFRERTLKVSPGATVVLPFTFFPQIPSYHHQKHDEDNEYDSSLGSISKESALDLASILNIDPLDLGRHQLYDVITRIEVDSDHGIYKAHIHTSAQKSSLYRLPHTIVFERDGFVHSDSVFVKRQRAGYRKTAMKEVVAYEYDIYVDNPFDEYLEIEQMYPSKPSYVTVDYWHASGRRNSTDEGYDRFNNCGFSPTEILHCNKPMTLEMTGPLSIIPGAKRVYIGTVKINKDLLENGGKLENVNEKSLGYLHFQTEMLDNSWFFSIALEFLSSGESIYSIDDESDSQDELYTKSNQDPAAEVRRDIPLRNTPSVDNANVPPLDGWLYHCDAGPTSKPLFVSNGSQQDLYKKRHANVRVPQISKEQPVDFGLVTDVGDKLPCPVAVTNMHDIPIRLMHQRFSFEHSESEKDSFWQNSPFHDEHISDLNHLVEDFDASETIEPGETMHNLVNADVDFSGLMSPGEKLEEYHGSLIMRFGPANMTYDKWIASLQDDPEMIQKFVVELPLVARTIRGKIEHDVSQTFFPADILAHLERHASKKCVNAFDRKISITNQFSFPLRLNRIQIKGGNNEEKNTALSAATCSNYFSSVGFDSEFRNALPGQMWGDITVRYEYDKDIYGELDAMKSPKHCLLVMHTEEAGQFHIPLWIYKGEVMTTTEDSITPPECRAKGDDESSLTGFDCLDAIQFSDRVGFILSESLRNISTDKTKTDHVKSYSIGEKGWIEQIKDYYSSVASEINANDSAIHPVVLSFGIVSAGTIDTRSIFIKNQNPVPIDITATVAAVEGMEVRLARVAVNVNDYIQLAKDNVDIDENSTNAWLRSYLSEAQGPAREYLQSFTYRDDISLMADVPLVLKQLFHNTASVRLRRSMSRRRRKTSIQNSTTNGALGISPPGFQQDVFPKHPQDLTLGPLLVTLDDNSAYPIMARNGSEDMLATWNVPPGAMARLEVTIRTPTKSALHNRDFSEILTTGIALKTSIGQIIPIVATYKTLSGILEMSSATKNGNSNDGKKVLPVPSILRSGAERREEGPSSLEVEIHNTFASDILLKDLESCNKWFRFDGDLPKRVATNESYTTMVRASLSCDKSIPGLFPSFYHCALEWLEQKYSIQASSCGVLSDDFDNEFDGLSNNETNAVDTLVMTNVLKRAARFMDKNYAEKGPNTFDEQNHVGVNFNLNLAKGTAAEWRALSKAGMTKIRGYVRTRFELIENKTLSSPTITSMLSSKILETNLDFPYLTGKLNRFNLTGIGEVSMMYVPIRNPSGYPVRVRIVEEGNSPFYIHKTKKKDPWWTGGTYYIPDDSMEIFHRSMHNVTVQTPTGSELGMHSPSLHSTTAFSHGCSDRRCGYNFGPGGNHHQYNLERRKISTIGASAINGAHLTGRMYNRDGTPVRVPLNTTNAKTRWFGINEKNLQEFVLPPYGSKEIGPFYFRPYAKGRYSGYLILENTLTGFEALRFQGAASSGKIGFFDNNERKNKGGDIEQRYGRTALIFRDVDQNESEFVTKTVLVGNLGDMAVEVINVYLSATQVSVLHVGGISKSCKVNGFRLIDCVKTGDVDRRDGFVLAPTQSKLIHIAHEHGCVFRSMYASLVIEYKSSPTSSVVKTTELMLGYEMSDDEISACDKMNSPVLTLHSYHNTSLCSFLFRILSCLFPFVLLFILTWDMIANARQRNVSSAQFRNAICASARKTTKSKKTGFKTWSSAYRCLARAEPTSAELVQIGKEQTRQMLLNTYRKEEISLPQCVLANGAFSRERQGSPAGDADGKSSHRQSNTMAMTLNDAIFSKQKAYQQIVPSDAVPILPLGLGWRVIAAMRSDARGPRKMSRSDIKNKTQKESNGLVKRVTPPQKKAAAASQINFQRQVHYQKEISNRVVPQLSKEVSKKLEAIDNIIVSPTVSPGEDFVKVATSYFSAKSKLKARSALVQKSECCARVSKEATVAPRGNKTKRTTTIVVDDSAASIQHNQVVTSDLDVNVMERNYDTVKVDESISIINSKLVIGGENSEVLEVDSGDIIKLDAKAGAAELEENAPPKKETKSEVSSKEVFSEMKDDEGPIVSEVNELNEGTVSSSASTLGVNSIADAKDLGGASKAIPLSASNNSDQLCTEPTNESGKMGRNHDKLGLEAWALPVIMSPNPNDLAESELKVQCSSVTVGNCPSVVTLTKVVKKEKEENGNNDNVKALVDVQKNTSEKAAGKRKEKKRSKNKKNKFKPAAQDPHAQEKSSSPLKESEKVSKSPKRSDKLRSLRKKGDRNHSSKTIVSTTSDESSMTNMSPTPDGKQVIRPPPGLAPPPGFGGAAVCSQAPLSLDSPIQYNREENRLGVNESDVELLANVLNGENALSLSPVRGSEVHLIAEREEIRTEHLMPGIVQDSNVMNFLTFLDESIDDGDDHSETNEGDIRPIIGEETNYEPLPLYGGLSNNPWSDSTRTPRAFAYGFGVEQGGRNDTNEIESKVMDPTLLTPALIFGHAPRESDDDQVKAADSFDADAFFSDLLE